MKKVMMSLLLVMILLLIATGGFVAYTYFTIDETSILPASLVVNGQSVKPNITKWNTAVLNGLIHKSFEKEENNLYDVGTVDLPHLPIDTNENISIIKVRDNQNKLLFQGNQLAYNQFKLPQNGEYTIQVIANSFQKSPKDSYGEFTYSMRVSLKVEPTIITSDTNVIQGDVFAIEVRNTPEGIVPTAQSELGMSVFTSINERYIAYIPIGYRRETGEYPILVSCGDFSKEIMVQVVEGSFEKQYLTIDTSNPVISEASSPKAYQQYRDSIYPLYETADEQTHWSGKFLKPVQGWISTQYGLLRYTNGSKTPSGHSGIDIATATGTPIVAPANGRVVFADYLLNTGNTLVIEHGGGLKSYFYHMNRLDVKADDMVQKGDFVGEVGTTGYSTGPHLHYETRIGNQSINPWNLFNGTGGFFSLEQSE